MIWINRISWINKHHDHFCIAQCNPKIAQFVMMRFFKLKFIEYFTSTWILQSVIFDYNLDPNIFLNLRRVRLPTSPHTGIADSYQMPILSYALM
jgi:hypothetical protein